MTILFKILKNTLPVGLLVMWFCAGCKKLVTVNAPLSSPDGAVIYSTNASATSVMTGLYSQLGASSVFNGSNSISVIAGLTADELHALPSYIPLIKQAYQNALTATNAPFWSNLYTYIYTTNDVLQGVASSTTISSVVRQQLEGEAKFMRAFFYFYLVNLFGDVPLITTTDYNVSAAASRTSSQQVYQQIISDLKDAGQLLSNNYLAADLKTTSSDRVRPTTWAANALLSRVYLYSGYWDSAVTQATIVINNSSVFRLSSLDNVFLANSSEAIWQIQPTVIGYNTLDASTFILSSGPNPYLNFVSLSNNLLNTFEAGDNRLNNWVGRDTTTAITYYYSHKYKVGTYSVGQPLSEYLMILRLAEQYLIRAESEANGSGSGISGAISDLNMIRIRAGLSIYSGLVSKDSVLAAILHERQVEFFTEIGQRWLDLKRTGTINALMGSPGNVCAAKGGRWDPDWALYPIPLTTAIEASVNLKQNNGYGQ